ncbi:hypothetical protein [Caulobacter sp. 17J65-9]|uniref:hypothetical protein n=1 Tax=Caulobacter sp. 17J65-9 TaxID=2709382 RepID=UPI0013CA7548|nr:hypothetical protein [Caulobacter sp. 17J65-9]NEX91144.1 hypothetical protein [Caulobacter sp. 17J65-9]
MRAEAASLKGWRAVVTVAAVVLGLLLALMSQAAHASEITEHGSHAEAALVEHDHGDGSPIHKIFHVGHCSSHCTGHTAVAPPLAGGGGLPIVDAMDWDTPEPHQLTGLAQAVQDQPPRG